MASRWTRVPCCDRRQIPHVPGIYALFADDALQYIGKAGVSIQSRLTGHDRLKEIRETVSVDRISIAFSPDRYEREWDKRERQLIRRTRPPLNTQFLLDRPRPRQTAMRQLVRSAPANPSPIGIGSPISDALYAKFEAWRLSQSAPKAEAPSPQRLRTTRAYSPWHADSFGQSLV